MRVQGPDAADLLQRIVSNDVLAAESCEALLLTAKGRVIAPLLVWRRGEDDFLLLTEPELGDVVLGHLRKMRVASQCEIEPEDHTSAIVFGEGDGIPNHDYGASQSKCSTPVVEPSRSTKSSNDSAFWRARRAGARSSTTGSFPARRGSRSARSRSPRVATRGRSRWRACTTAATSTARCACSMSRANHARRDEVRYEGAPVGRVTSAVSGLALAYVRVEVPGGAALEVGGHRARLH